MGEDAPGRFEAMREALLAYRFYPESVMESAAAFKTEKRFARVGDRIGMALLVPVFPGLPALRFPSTTEIHFVENSPERAALGYITTRRHYGRGTWSATLLHSGGKIRLELYSRMKPTAALALLGLPVYRFMQNEPTGSARRTCAAASPKGSAFFQARLYQRMANFNEGIGQLPQKTLGNGFLKQAVFAWPSVRAIKGPKENVKK